MGLFVIDIAWPSGGFVALICCHCGGFMVVYSGIMVVCEVGFGSISMGVSLAVGCRVARGGLWGGSWWWFSFLVNFGGFGCEFFSLFCFMLLQTHSVKYFLEHFRRMQTNIEKKLFSLKSFAFENILQCKMLYNETNGALHNHISYSLF